MDCKQIKELLSEYVDDMLSAETKAQVDKHLAECSGCAKELQELKLYLNEINFLEEVKAPSDFLEKVQQRLKQKPETKNIIHRLFPFKSKKIPLEILGFAAAAMLVFYLHSNIFKDKYVPFKSESLSEKEQAITDLKKDKQVPIDIDLIKTEEKSLEFSETEALETTLKKEVQAPYKKLRQSQRLSEDHYYQRKPEPVLEQDEPAKQKQDKRYRITKEAKKSEECLETEEKEQYLRDNEKLLGVEGNLDLYGKDLDAQTAEKPKTATYSEAEKDELKNNIDIKGSVSVSTIENLKETLAESSLERTDALEKIAVNEKPADLAETRKEIIKLIESFKGKIITQTANNISLEIAVTKKELFLKELEKIADIKKEVKIKYRETKDKVLIEIEFVTAGNKLE